MSEILHDWRPQRYFTHSSRRKNTIVMLEISFWLSGVISGTLKNVRRIRNCCSVTNKIRLHLSLGTMTHRLLHLASSASKGQQTANKQTSSDLCRQHSLKVTHHDSVTTPPEVNFNWPHLFLQLSQLARQVGHQFHGGLQLLLQASDLILLPICITADQRHGPHPWEPVQVLVLKAQSMTRVQHVTSEIPAFLQRSCLFYEVEFGPFPTINSSFASSTRCCDFVKIKSFWDFSCWNHTFPRWFPLSSLETPQRMKLTKRQASAFPTNPFFHICGQGKHTSL